MPSPSSVNGFYCAGSPLFEELVELMDVQADSKVARRPLGPGDALVIIDMQRDFAPTVSSEYHMPHHERHARRSSPRPPNSPAPSARRAASPDPRLIAPANRPIEWNVG